MSSNQGDDPTPGGNEDDSPPPDADRDGRQSGALKWALSSWGRTAAIALTYSYSVAREVRSIIRSEYGAVQARPLRPPNRLDDG